ncbi:MAG: nifR3 family TIM-barrel protein [Candidatus Berkelbacteria bacterium Licking1014_96]|uniref:tRNA-dihydrouridine synthase n=1 Tax=Candidatus Berkelbacteria bacterium Licking1014_96 TaxID=2017149 RepID=A0A554LG61_9BACT|nr:MAG: nifR3 family TIM-barrel protein [Candidatus Berkelbacteria bacterium Licking1014_96]
MDNFWRKFKKPIIALAPMAGISDSAFRQICKKEGADLVYSEMISSYGIIHNDKKTLSLCRFKQIERPIIIQIFGRDPRIMAEAAAVVENKFKPEGIDINFGCPARRVVKSGHGAALMDEPELAESIVRHIVKRIKIPLSVKTRLGARKKTEIFDFSRRMESVGAKAIAIHGRTLSQGFKGEADWGPIYKTAGIVKIPVLGNGDIKSNQEIKSRLKNLAGVLIGRGALGNPFIFGRQKEVSRKKIKETMLKHARLAEKEKGDRGLIEMRKHLGWYVKGWPKAKSLRQRLVRVETIEEIKKILNIKYQISNKMINY